METVGKHPSTDIGTQLQPEESTTGAQAALHHTNLSPAGLSQPAAAAAATVVAPEAAWYAELQDEITAFSQQIVPSAEEKQQRADVLELIKSLVRRIFSSHYPHMRVELFGSEATGLATHTSDMDVVITGG